MRIVNAVDNKYTLQDLVTMKNKDYHITKLRPFIFDESTQNPLDYAVRDDQDCYVVEKITALKGSPTGPKKNIYLKVHWVGYKEPSWEKWSRMRNSIALQNFLQHHKKQTYRGLCPTNITLGQENEESDIESDLDINYDSGNNSELSSDEEEEV
jgi:hypothetical protein